MANGTGRDRDRFSGCVKITLARDVNERRKEARKGAAALAFRNFVCGKYLNKVTNREMRMFLRKLGRGVVARISLAMKRLPPMFKLKPKNSFLPILCQCSVIFTVIGRCPKAGDEIPPKGHSTP